MFYHIPLNSSFGIFNVSVTAKNPVTEIAPFDEIMSIVTAVCFHLVTLIFY